MIIGGADPGDIIEALRHPGIAIAEHLLGRPTDQVFGRQLKNSTRGFVGLDDFEPVIERHDAVRQRFEDALVIVLQLQHVGEQLRILDRDGNFGGKGFEPADIGSGERPAALVQHLQHAEMLAGPVDDRHVEQVAGAEARPPIDLRIEQRVGIGVGDVEHLAAGKGRAGDPGLRRDADLRLAGALGDFRPQLVARRVINEQCRALRIEQPRGSMHDAGEQRVDAQLGRDRLGDRQQLFFLAPQAIELFHQLRLLERARRLSADRFQQGGVDLGEAPRMLVQNLRHADRLAVTITQRRTEDVARAIPGPPVHLLVEARVLIGVGDDLGRSRAEHRAGDTGGRPDPYLGHSLALGDAREQLARFRIMKKKGGALGIERRDDQFDQPRQLMIERQLAGDRVCDFDEQQQAPHPLVRAVEVGHVAGGERRKHRPGGDRVRSVGDDPLDKFGVALHADRRSPWSEPFPHCRWALWSCGILA